MFYKTDYKLSSLRNEPMGYLISKNGSDSFVCENKKSYVW